MITIIVAMDQQCLIGKKASSHGMPWHNKEDLQHFKKTTIHQTILMGHTTYRVIGRPLPHRHTIVISSQPFEDEHVEVRTSFKEVILEYQNKHQDLFIAGGASIYRQALPYADRLLISRIPGVHEGETYFPDFQSENFVLKEVKPYETFCLEIYQRGGQ